MASMRGRRLFLVLAFASLTAAARADGGFSGAMRVQLHGAILPAGVQDPQMETARNLMLLMEAENGRWERIYGTALSLNNGDHYGFVQQCEVEGDNITLDILVTVGADIWIAGGEGRLKLQMKRVAPDGIEGTYGGTLLGHTVMGRITGVIGPLRPMRIKDHKPFDPTERPRLLFRRHELPKVKEKLATPFGQIFLARAKEAAEKGDLICLGMLYQLTGEKSYAEKAQKVIERFKGDLAPEGGAGSGGIGHQFVAICLAYDMCVEAWPGDFKQDLVTAMEQNISVMQRRLQVAGANFHPCSNYYGPGRGAAAIGSLALFGEKGPAPARPASPDELIAKGGLEAKLWAKTGQIDRYKREYPDLLAKWKTQQLEWEQTGGADKGKVEIFHASFLHMNRHYHFGIGDGGYGAETGAYADIASFYPLVYNTYYLKMYGKDASFRPNVKYLVLRRLMETIFLPNGQTTAVPLGPACGWNTGFAAAGFPAIPDEYKPAVLWAWNYTTGVKEGDQSTLAKLLPAQSGGLGLAHTFLHYPLDMKSVHPKDLMPRNWEAGGFGWYCFRNGWEGKDDIIAQVFAKRMPIGGWSLPNAGTVRLQGLGHVWVSGKHSKEAYRHEEPVLLLPEDKVHVGLFGQVTHVALQKDGSGSVTIDMNDLYGTTKLVQNTRRKEIRTVAGGIVIDSNKKPEDGPDLVRAPLWDRNGIRIPENWEDSGLTGLRAFGFDYSGKSGSPMLMVIVDKVQGGKVRDWNWPLPSAGDKKSGGEAPTVKAEGNTFTLNYGEASLRATFVSPEAVKIDPDKHVEIDYKRWQGARVEFKRVSVTADRGSFFVVLTLQRGAPPAVKVEGSGLDAKVTVGQQTVRFDGQKVVFGPG